MMPLSVITLLCLCALQAHAHGVADEDKLFLSQTP